MRVKGRAGCMLPNSRRQIGLISLCVIVQLSTVALDWSLFPAVVKWERMEGNVALVAFILLSNGCIISEMLYRATCMMQPSVLTGFSTADPFYDTDDGALGWCRWSQSDGSKWQLLWFFGHKTHF